MSNDRRRLPDERRSITRKLSIRHADANGKMVETDIYVHVGLYDDGSPGEVFIETDKEGSTISGLLDAMSICLSLGLQYGVPVSAYTSKLTSMRFEPGGPSNLEGVAFASSIVDLVARWLDSKFPSKTGEEKT